jgi:PAS domain S-box-containing protein
MAKALAVLIVEDMESDAQLLVRMLTKAGYRLTFERVETAAQMRSALEKQAWDMVISDFNMPELDGFGSLKLLQETGVDIPFIVVSGTMGEETAVAMMKAGAHDYLMKGKLAHLVPAVERELAQAEVLRQSKQAEEALRTSEHQHQAILETAMDGFWLVDTQGSLLEVNRTYCQMSGYTEQELLGMRISDLESIESARDTAARIQKILEQGEDRFESRHHRKDGSIFEVEISVQYRPEKGGHMVAFLQDISERKLKENQVRESKALFETVVENIPLMIFLKEAVDLRFVMFNKAGEELLGYNRKELLGKNNLDLFPPEQADNFMTKDREVLDGEAGLLDIPEEPIQTARKGQRLLHTRKVSIRGTDGATKFLLGISEDITERKQREEDILDRNKELAALYTLSRQLADAEDLENVLDLVVRHSVDSVHITFACIALITEGKLTPKVIYPVRIMDQDIKMSPSQSITSLPVCQNILEKNEPVVLQTSDPGISSLERTILFLDRAQSVCLVPLQVVDPIQSSNLAMGVLILGEARAEQRSPFSSEKKLLAGSLGDQAASAIRRMLETEQARRRLQRIASLSEIDSAIASSFDLRISLDMILKHVVEQLGVDAADILVVNTSLQILETRAGSGFRSQAMEHIQQRFGEGLAGKAMIERSVIQVPEVASSLAAFARPDLMKLEQFCSYMAIPLIIKGQVNGVLEIYQRTALEINQEWLEFLNSLAGQAAIAIDNDQMFYGLQRSNIDLGLAYDATIEGWSHALDLRDKETEGHTQRVTEMTVQLAKSFNISNEAIRQIRWGALLHDIGKLGVPDGILLKPDQLTEDEWVLMKKHPVFAYEMLAPIQYLKAALDIPYCHHEKWDGSGYPRGLKGEQIPLTARIFAVVDVWDALISDRPYRKAWTKEKAHEHILNSSGTHFDPQVVKYFLLENN